MGSLANGVDQESYIPDVVMLLTALQFFQQ